MVAKKKGAGSGLARTQVVTVRLDPKLKFAAELAARKQRRTISSFIEWAVEQAIERVEINSGDMKNPLYTIFDALGTAWDVEESARVVKLAIHHPQLLSYEEEQIWKIICECGHFWSGGSKPDVPHHNTLESRLHFDRVREQWDVLHKIIDGESSLGVLNSLPIDEPFPTSQSSLPF